MTVSKNVTISKSPKSLKTSMSLEMGHGRLGTPGSTGMPPKHLRRCSVSASDRIMPPSIPTTVGHLPNMSKRLCTHLQKEGHKALRYESFPTETSMTSTACCLKAGITMVIELRDGRTRVERVERSHAEESQEERLMLTSNVTL